MNGGGPLDRAEELLQAIHAVSLVEDLDQFGTNVLELVDRLVPSDLVSYNEVDPLAGRALVVGRPYQPTTESLEVWRRWAHQNPCLEYVLRTGDGSAKRFSDFLTSDELHRLEIYKEVYAPLGVEYQVAFCLPAPAPLVIGIALNRFELDFTDEEVHVLDLIRPHLVQAYRRVELLNQQRTALESVTDFLRDEGQAFHIVGEPLSESSVDFLVAYFGQTDGTLPKTVTSWLNRERAALASADPRRLRQPLVCDREGRRLTVQYVPGANGLEMLWLHERSSPGNAQTLQRLGLSEREADILWRLTQGTSTKAIAGDLGISVLTVKKHLEHVYRKLGVSNRTAAVSLAFDALTFRQANT